MTAPLPPATVFGFFEDARNLEKITPPWLNFRIVNPDGIHMRTGTEIEYVIRWMGVPLRWKTLITGYHPPHEFTDQQARGPYQLWHHQHTFTQTTEGVLISDRVDYRLPLGFLGRIAHAVLVKRQLLQIFRYRQQAIAGILNAPGITFRNPAITTAP